jgi:hypothetical protein
MSSTKGPTELTDDELLERIAAQDPEQIPLAKHCQRALQEDEDS